MLQHDPIFSLICIPEPKIRKRLVVELFKKSEINNLTPQQFERSLENAQLSFLTDKVTLNFIDEKPLSCEEFDSRLAPIVSSPASRDLISKRYGTLFDEWRAEQNELKKAESVEEMLSRHKDNPLIQKEVLASVNTIALLREGITHGKVKTKLIEDCLDWMVNYFQLPFVDIIYSQSNFPTLMDVSPEYRPKGLCLNGNYPFIPLVHEQRGRAGIFLQPNQAGRYLIELAIPSDIKDRSEEYLLILRHELRHLINGKIFPFFEKRQQKPNFQKLSLEQRREVCEAVLIDEIIAGSVNNYLGYFETDYFNFEISELERALDGDIKAGKVTQSQAAEEQKRLDKFSIEWKPVIQIINSWNKIFGDTDLRLAHIVLYHFISNSQSTSDLMINFKSAKFYIEHVLEADKDNQEGGLTAA